MANQLRQQIDQISREKNINPDVIIAAIEDAILTASKKYYKNNEDLRSRFNDESGQIEVFAVKQIVEEVEIDETQISLSEAQKLIPEAEVGQEIEFPKPTDILGRIAAQTAKQVIFQKVREAERDNVFSEYSGRVGEVLNGIIKRQEMGDFVVDLGRAEALLPRKEQSRAETYQAGRPRARGAGQGDEVGQGPAGHRQPDRSSPARQAVRDGGARDLRRHRPDPWLRARGGRAREGGGRVAREGRRPGRRLRRHEGHPRAVDHPRAARREDRHRRVERGLDHVRREGAVPGQDQPRHDRRRRAADHGSGGRGQAALARHRQEGPERPPGRQARGLAHRHQERGREAPGGRGRDGAHAAHRRGAAQPARACRRTSPRS